MAYAAIYVAEFEVQAVVRAEAELRGAAVALLEGTRPLRKVVAANEAALDAGIEEGMTEWQAEDFSTVQVRARSQAQEKAAHAALRDVGWSVSPRLEDTAADTIVLDLAGLSSLLGSNERIAKELVERAARLGLAARVAVSANIETAIHAARGFTGVTVIPEGEEAKWLGRLPVSVLMAPGEDLQGGEILATLESWGIRTCEALAALPVLELSERLGQEGVRLHELARCARERAMAIAEPEIFFEEEMELEDAVPELEPLAFLLGRLLDQLCARLEARSLAAAAIRVRFELDAASEENVRRLNDIVPRKAEAQIYETALTLPVPTRNSKMLLKLMRLRLQAAPPKTAVQKIFMTAEAARSRAAQGGLFLPSAPDPERLELTIARLANLVGERNVGAPELVDTHRPDAFEMRRFLPARPAEGGSRLRGAVWKPGPVHADAAAAHEEDSDAGVRVRLALRVFRPALPAKVEMRDGRLARVAFSGRRGEVVAASGPWRTSGDWWREDGWEQDEWDIGVRFTTTMVTTGAGAAAANAGATAELAQRRGSIQRGSGHRDDLLSLSFPGGTSQPAEQHGLYCIYYDAARGSWFVRGMYD